MVGVVDVAIGMEVIMVCMVVFLEDVVVVTDIAGVAGVVAVVIVVLVVGVNGIMVLFSAENVTLNTFLMEVSFFACVS